MSRRQKTPRKAATYRGARRNAVLRPAQPAKPGVWPAVEARYVQWIAKPPIFKFNWTNLLLIPPKSPLVSVRERKQPKTYPYSSKRQTGRRRSA